MTTIKRYVIEETCEIYNTYEEAQAAIQEYREEGWFKAIENFTISEYITDNTPATTTVEPDFDIIHQLKQEGFNNKQVEEILMYVECGHGLDSAMQNVIMEMEV